MVMPKIKIKQAAVFVGATKSMLPAHSNANRVEADHG
jgi:hypothetical protein